MTTETLRPGMTRRYFDLDQPYGAPDQNARVLIAHTYPAQALAAIRFPGGGRWCIVPVSLLHPLRPSNAAIDALIDNWDSFDPWGSGMSALGAVCDVLDAMGEDHRIDPGAGFSRGMAPGYSVEEIAAGVDDHDDTMHPYDTVMLAAEVVGGHVTVDDLAKASRVLHLYLDMARRAGRDY